MFVNSRLTANRIIGQRSLNCARKEIVDIDILATPRNGDRKIMQSIRIMSRLPSKIRK